MEMKKYELKCWKCTETTLFLWNFEIVYLPVNLYIGINHFTCKVWVGNVLFGLEWWMGRWMDRWDNNTPLVRVENRKNIAWRCKTFREITFIWFLKSILFILSEKCSSSVVRRTHETTNQPSLAYEYYADNTFCQYLT